MKKRNLLFGSMLVLFFLLQNNQRITSGKAFTASISNSTKSSIFTKKNTTTIACDLPLNSDLENGTSNWWGFIATTDAYLGNGAGQINAAASAAQTMTGIAENTLYTLNFYAKKDSGSAAVVGMDFLNSAGTEIGEVTLGGVGANTWTEYSFSGTTPPETTRINIWIYNPSGVIKMDEFCLSGGATAVPEICDNNVDDDLDGFTDCDDVDCGCVTTSCELTIRARGNCGGEMIQLLADGSAVETFTLTSTFADYTFSEFTNDQNLSISFINDGSTTGCDFNVFVDYVNVGGTVLQTETVATHFNDCNTGENLYCNGMADFGSISNITCDPIEICDNGIDDDNDGLIDMADPDCEGFGEVDSEFTCQDGQDIEIVWEGLRNEIPKTLNLDNPSNITKVVVELVYLNFHPGATVSLTDNNGNTYTANRHVMGNNSLYSFELPANISSITYSETTAASSAQSIIAYVYRTVNEGVFEVAKFTEVEGYNDYKTFVIDIPKGAAERDLVVNIPVTEITLDGRWLQLRAWSGGVIDVETRNWTSLPNGCCVDMFELNLPNVPAEETEVWVAIESRSSQLPGNGQSYLIAGTVSVEVECSCPPLDLTIDNAGEVACLAESTTFSTPEIDALDGSNYTWNFGENATPADATGIGPHNVTYAVAGQKTVTLNVNDDVCVADATAPVTVNDNEYNLTIETMNPTTCNGTMPGEWTIDLTWTNAPAGENLILTHNGNEVHNAAPSGNSLSVNITNTTGNLGTITAYFANHPDCGISENLPPCPVNVNCDFYATIIESNCCQICPSGNVSVKTAYWKAENINLISSNVALHKPSIINGTLGGNSSNSHLSNDGRYEGDTDTFYDYAFSSIQNNNRWDIDLVGQYDLESMRIFTKTGCCLGNATNYRIFIAETPFTENDLADLMNQGVPNFSVPVNTNGNPSVLNNLNSLGRFVRVYLEGEGQMQLVEVEIIGSGNTNSSPYNYSWNDANIGNIPNPECLSSGNYQVQITDIATGCSANQTITIN